MDALTEAEYYKRAEPALRKVFLNDDPRLVTFGEAAECKKILYEYRTPDTQITSVLAQVASELGDNGFFFSVLLRNPGEDENFNHWWIPFEELSVYLSSNTDIFNFAYQFENAIYSPSGLWGLMWSFENFGVLAGRKDCINRVCQILPSVEEQILVFLDDIKQCKSLWGDESVNITWLQPLLQRTFGREASARMLADAQLL